MILLTKEDIVIINQATIEAHGGNFVPPHNFLHEENLDYLVEIVNSTMYGVALYPTIQDKAAVYFYNIISNHIFSDGNKRTGLEACILFLRINDMNLDRNLSHLDLIKFTLSIASGELSLDETREWVHQNSIKEKWMRIV